MAEGRGGAFPDFNLTNADGTPVMNLGMGGPAPPGRGGGPTESAAPPPPEAAPDPRVDAWYAEHPTDQTSGGPGVVPYMLQMLQDIPDAGKGSSLGMAAPGSRFNPQFLGGGGDNPSTNNWRLLPYPYNRPGYIMRNGIVIDTNDPAYRAGYPAGFGGGMRLNDAGQNAPISGVYSPHTGPHNGYPASYGLRGLNYGWPGALWGWQGGGWDMG